MLSRQGWGWVHARPLVPGLTSAGDSSIGDVRARCSYSIVDCLALEDLAVLPVAVFARLKSTDTASAAYMAVDPATVAIADNTVAAVSVADFRR